MFPYPNRFLLARPSREGSLTSHGGFFRIIENGKFEIARRIWAIQRSAHSLAKRTIFQIIEEEFSESAKILLVGCGTDEPLLFRTLHPQNRISAIDLSSKSVSRAKLKLAMFGNESHKTNFVVGDFLTQVLPKEWTAFDYIQSFGVIHHQNDPKLFFEKLVTILAPRGVLRVMVYSCTGRRLERKIQSKNIELWQQNSSCWQIRKEHISMFVSHILSFFLLGKTGWRNRFRYLGASPSSVADALLHPSDPGLSPAQLCQWAKNSGLKTLFCEANVYSKGWIAGIENPEEILSEILLAESNSNLVSNITLVFQKPC
jgi:SAM-dependent methyltransferase